MRIIIYYLVTPIIAYRMKMNQTTSISKYPCSRSVCNFKSSTKNRDVNLSEKSVQALLAAFVLKVNPGYLKIRE